MRTLDLALLQAGAGIKGEFENRLKGLIEEVKSSPTPIILFIDEAHTMIGAGGQAGQNDAANLLKPALARGELRTIAATTWSEYKKYFEKDPALARRFQVVKVEEPDRSPVRGDAARHRRPRWRSTTTCASWTKGLAAAVKLSHRYLAGRQLPDKAVSVLDTACARLALGQNATPPAIEDATRQIDDCTVQKRILEREAGARRGPRRAPRRAAQAQGRGGSSPGGIDGALGEGARPGKQDPRGARQAGTGASRADPAARTRSGGRTATAPAVQPAPDPEALRAELAALNTELEQLQGETPLMRVCVDAQIVGEVISAWTGIPVGKMVKDEMQPCSSWNRTWASA